MKKWFIISNLLIIFLNACTKTNVEPGTGNFNSSSETDLSVQTKSRTALITAHTWMYQGFYFHYADQTHKGDPQYIRGASNNIVPLDNTRITYKTNGTFLETDGGYQYPGTWKFTNTADTSLVMVFSYATDVNAIVSLNDKHFNYTMPIGSYSHHNFAYTELVPAK